MNFEKLNLDAFSQEKLTENNLRSVTGGGMITLTLSTGEPTNTFGEGDIIFADKETWYSDLDHTVCDDGMI